MHWNVNSITLCCWYCRCSSLQSLKLACKLCDVNLVKNGQAFICFLILPYVLWLGCIHNWNIYSNRKLCVGAFVLRQLLPSILRFTLFVVWTMNSDDDWQSYIQCVIYTICLSIFPCFCRASYVAVARFGCFIHFSQKCSFDPFVCLICMVFLSIHIEGEESPVLNWSAKENRMSKSLDFCQSLKDDNIF